MRTILRMLPAFLRTTALRAEGPPPAPTAPRIPNLVPDFLSDTLSPMEETDK